jgi:hypothetical protein
VKRSTLRFDPTPKRDVFQEIGPRAQKLLTVLGSIINITGGGRGGEEYSYIANGHLILHKILPQKLHEIEPSFFT